MLKIQSNDTRRIIMKFEDFFRTQKYANQIKYIINRAGKKLFFYYEDLQKYNPQLAESLRNRPENTLRFAETALKNILKGYLRDKMREKDSGAGDNER